MPCRKDRHHAEILPSRFFRTVRLWSSYTHRSARIHRSHTLETRFTLSRGEKVCSLTECSGTPWKSVHSYLFLPATSTALRTFHQTSLFGSLFTDRKEARRSLMR